MPCDPSVFDPTWVDVSCFNWLDKKVTHPYAAPCGGTVGQPWHVQNIEGRYYRSFVLDGNVQFQQSLFNLPIPGGTWNIDANIFSTGDAIAARFCWQQGLRRLWMVLERDEAGTRKLYWTWSDDEGATWETPAYIVSAYSGSDWADADGNIGRCWFEFDSGTSGPGKAKGQLHGATDMTGGVFHFTVAYTFKDETGTDISVAENGMSNVMPASGFANMLTWSPTLNGDTSPSTFYSTDLGITWTKF